MTAPPPHRPVMPPRALCVYEPSQWLPLVEPDVDSARREERARTLWSCARLDWQRQHGWPRGLTAKDLLADAVTQTRRTP